MRDIVISAMLIFVLSLLNLEHSSSIAALVGAEFSIHLVWSLKGKKPPLQFHSRFLTIYINVLLSILLLGLLLFSGALPFFLGFIWGYTIGAGLTYVAITEAHRA